MRGHKKTGVNRAQFAQLLANQVNFIVAARPLETQTLVTAETPEIPGFDDAIVFPGAFNPLHDAHLAMANLASRRYQRPLWFEISMENVDKPVLDFVEVANRTQQANYPHGMILTRTPTFEQKSHLFAGCIFVVGADTIARINELEYYNHDSTARNASIQTIAENGCRFLVFARKQAKIAFAGSNFEFGGPLVPQLGALCEFVSAAEFCMEISSTDIRNRQQN